MRTIQYTNQFKKDIDKVQQYPSFSREIFIEYTEILAKGEKLPPKAKDHKLSKSSPKKYQNLKDFHISPDICIVYDLQKDSIILHRIGKHNTLGLTEDMY